MTMGMRTRSAGVFSFSASAGAQTGKTISSRRRSASASAQPPRPTRSAISTSPRPNGTKRSSASIRSLISGWRAAKAGRRWTSQREARMGATEMVSTMSSRWRMSPTAWDRIEKPSWRRARKPPAPASGTRPLPVRSNRAAPSSVSIRATCWLTAPGETPSSSAAAARLPRRATASAARRPLR